MSLCRLPLRSLFLQQRSLSTAVPQIFDRHVKRIQRDRAASDADQSRVVDYVKDAVAERVVDRLLDIKRRFPVVADIGAGAGHCYKFVDNDMMDELIQCDMSERLLFRDAEIPSESGVRTKRLVVDEEHALPFEPNSLDGALSSLSLHWTNDLPGSLKQICRALKPDAPFIGAMFAGDTLYELRCSFQLAELERYGGVAPHISPFVQNADVAGLLSSAGFTLTTIDIDEIVVNYPSPFELMQDLQAMAENNAIINRKSSISRDTLIAMASIYKEIYGNEDGTIPATFQIIYMIGWKPAPNQPKPSKRGSATVSLKDLNDLDLNKPK